MSGKKQRQAESMHLITNCRPGTDLGVAPFARSLGDVITAIPNRFHVVDQKHDRVGCRAMELGSVSAEWAPVLVRTKGLFLPGSTELSIRRGSCCVPKRSIPSGRGIRSG